MSNLECLLLFLGMSVSIVSCVSAHNYFFGKNMTEFDKSVEGHVAVIGLVVIVILFIVDNLVLKTV